MNNPQKLLFPKESFSTWKQQSTGEHIKTYEELEEERNQLQRVINIQNALTDELIRSNRLTNILSILKEYITVPIIIENHKEKITDYENIQLEEAKELQCSFHKKLKKWHLKKTEFLEFEDHCRLVTPIYFTKSDYGILFFYL